MVLLCGVYIIWYYFILFYVYICVYFCIIAQTYLSSVHSKLVLSFPFYFPSIWCDVNKIFKLINLQEDVSVHHKGLHIYNIRGMLLW